MHRIRNCCHHFYFHVAKLFYAVASIDGSIRDDECKSMEQALRNEWLTVYKGKKDIVEEIVRCFYEIRETAITAQQAFDEFVLYKKAHERLFTKQMKKILWEVSCIMADAINRKNKSELILLVHLGQELGIMKTR